LITTQLIEAIRNQYLLPWNGIHGIGHWARVHENGLCVAERHVDVNTKVVELFAIFHDAKRTNEGFDKGHGYRGAEFAKKLRGSLFELSDEEFDLLYTACCFHTDGYTEFDITVQTCWDADRLDLGRVGITPHPRYLCTSAAKDPALIAWADSRVRQGTVPQFAIENWFANSPGDNRE
jgi:uncharacterized protein